MKIRSVAPYKIQPPDGFEQIITHDWLLALNAEPSFSLEWIRKFVHRHPPSVCEQGGKFVLIGGLRSYVWTVKSFPAEKIPVIVENSEVDDPLCELIQAEFTTLFLVLSGNQKSAGENLKRLWFALEKDEWRRISEELTSKLGLARLSGLNRRAIAQPKKMEPTSEFRRYSQ